MNHVDRSLFQGLPGVPAR